MKVCPEWLTIQGGNKISEFVAAPHHDKISESLVMRTRNRANGASKRERTGGHRPGAWAAYQKK